MFTTRNLIYIFEMFTGVYLRLLHVGVLLEKLFQFYGEDLVSDPDDHILNSTHNLPIAAVFQYEHVSVARAPLVTSGLNPGY
jgi:hypothetical protein